MEHVCPAYLLRRRGKYACLVVMGALGTLVCTNTDCAFPAIWPISPSTHRSEAYREKKLDIDEISVNAREEGLTRMRCASSEMPLLYQAIYKGTAIESSR